MRFVEKLDIAIGLAQLAHLLAEAWKHWNEAESERMRRRLDKAGK